MMTKKEQNFYIYAHFYFPVFLLKLWQNMHIIDCNCNWGLIFTCFSPFLCYLFNVRYVFFLGWNDVIMVINHIKSSPPPNICNYLLKLYRYIYLLNWFTLLFIYFEKKGALDLNPFKKKGNERKGNRNKNWWHVPLKRSKTTYDDF